MTCREFKDSAAALTLWELSRGLDEEIVSHGQQCESCGRWLQEQSTLAASLQTLQARTAGVGASANVERTVLRAFRQRVAGISAIAGSSPQAAEIMTADVTRDGLEGRLPDRWSATAPSSAPFALRLSRFFEIGAYVAIAAAVIVRLFLGLRLLQHSSKAPVQSRTVQSSTSPVAQKPVIAAQPSSASEQDSTKVTSVETAKHVIRASRPRAEAAHSSRGALVAAEPASNEESQGDTDDGYVALMLCDPLSCSSGTQVVRMELPASANAGNQSSQPQVADVVVGYDGIVRAVRIVN